MYVLRAHQWIKTEPSQRSSQASEEEQAWNFQREWKEVRQFRLRKESGHREEDSWPDEFYLWESLTVLLIESWDQELVSWELHLPTNCTRGLPQLQYMILWPILLEDKVRLTLEEESSITCKLLLSTLIFPGMLMFCSTGSSDWAETTLTEWNGVASEAHRSGSTGQNALSASVLLLGCLPAHSLRELIARHPHL